MHQRFLLPFSMLRTDIERELKNQANPDKATIYLRFFKTGKGEYGEGDKFLGLTVPETRAIVNRHWKTIEYDDVLYFLHSKYHEVRMFALSCLTRKFTHTTDSDEQKKIFDLYLANTVWINNWDLVDVTAPTIVGGYLMSRKRNTLYELARSKNLWEQRVSIIATAAFIAEKDFVDTFTIADLLLHHPHDLIHKAVGWMLREVGNKDLPAEESFLKERYKTMPRTMLRYAIEKFEETKRQKYLKGLI